MALHFLYYFLFLLASNLSSIHAAKCPKTLPKNSNFETGTLKPWINFGLSDTVKISSPGYQSQYSALLAAHSANGGAVLEGDVPTCANATYTVSFAYYQRPGTVAKQAMPELSVRVADLRNEDYLLYYGIDFNSGNNPDSVGNMPHAWHVEEAGNFTGTGYTLQLRVDLDTHGPQDAVSVYLDNITVRKVS